MLLPDVNVLLAGFRSDHIHHQPARIFLEKARAQTQTLAISDVALTSLVRLATNPRVFVQPDTVDAVLDYIDALLDPPAEVITAGAGHWPRFVALCRALNLRGNLVPDAYLAALALEQRARERRVPCVWRFGWPHQSCVTTSRDTRRAPSTRRAR